MSSLAFQEVNPGLRLLFDLGVRIFTHFPQIFANYLGYALPTSIITRSRRRTLKRVLPTLQTLISRVNEEVKDDFETAVEMVEILMGGVGEADENMDILEKMVGRTCEAWDVPDTGECVEVAGEEPFLACAGVSLNLKNNEICFVFLLAWADKHDFCPLCSVNAHSTVEKVRRCQYLGCLAT